MRPDRVVVGDALGVVPHPIPVDHPGPGLLGDRDHPAVDVRGHTGEHLLRDATHPGGPVGPHQFVVAADTAAGDDHRLRAKLELANYFSRRRDSTPLGRRLQHATPDPRHRLALDDQLVDLVPVRELHLRVVDQPARENFDDGRPGAPGDVEARHRIAVSLSAIAAALGPAHQREDLQTPLAQPASLLPGREIDIGMRPLLGPVVLLAVERRGAEPVLQREFLAVVYAEPTLLGAVDEEQAAERPERLPAEVGAVLLIEDQYPFAAIGHLAGRYQAGQARPDDDDISLGIAHGATQ